MRLYQLEIIVSLLAFFIVACGGDANETEDTSIDSSASTEQIDTVGDTGTGSNSDINADTHADTNSDNNSDTDSQTNDGTGTGAGMDTVGDTGTAPVDDTNGDSAGDTNADTNSDTGTMSDTGAQSGTNECNDGIDNDGDGLVDWQFDMGCYSAADPTERSLSRSEENGWTTFDLHEDSTIIYVSSSTGDDAENGMTPDRAVKTLARGAELVRDGHPDFMLLKRGDTWRGEDIGPDRVVRRFKSGLDKDHPIVISSYGDSTERPRLEINKNLIDHDGNERNYVAIVGLALISYPKDPNDPEFDGKGGGGLRLIGDGHDILVEDNYVEYGEFVVQNETDVEIRRNVVYRSYESGTCAYNDDGSRNTHGNSDIRPSGMFCGGVNGLLIEENVWDENGWNPDVAEACATIYNHDFYLSGNSRVAVRSNLILRASSIGIKVSSKEQGQVTDFVIENNLFAEGEIGISMGGNADTSYRFVDTVVRDNVFTDIGRSQPTTRTLTWYINIIDNDGAEITGNLLVNQPDLSNAYGIQLEGGTNRDITIADNLMVGLEKRLISVRDGNNFENIVVDNNTLVSDAAEDCLVSVAPNVDAFTFSNNQYNSPADTGSWFCVDGTRSSLEDWTTASGGQGESTASITSPDAGRNLDSYATHLGLGATLADFASAARQQSRHSWRHDLTAATANNYIREGFGMK